MSPFIIMSFGLTVLAVLSGMLGLGVAFAAVPFLSLYLPDLVNQVQPLTLLLNGLTALFATFGFAKSGKVVWKDAIALALITTLAAPIGAYLAHSVRTTYILYVYLAVVSFTWHTASSDQLRVARDGKICCMLHFSSPSLFLF